MKKVNKIDKNLINIEDDKSYLKKREKDKEKLSKRERKKN